MERDRGVMLERHPRAAAADDPMAVAIQYVTDGVIVVDAAGRITFLNPSAEAITGAPAGEVIGKPLARALSIVHDDTETPIESPFISVRQSGERVRLPPNAVIVGRQGSRIPVECSASPIRDAQ